MTGGSLPAMTWHQFMDYAHNGIELARMPGVDAETLPRLARAAPTTQADEDAEAPQPRVLKRRTQELLLGIGDNLRRIVAQDSAKADIEPATSTAATDLAAAQ
ncbi:hypothetical protein QW131_12575 [Roseibium salinum]|nr:hypothetical protein [Roseibium salinum]